jgi:hypothetical protein
MTTKTMSVGGAVIFWTLCEQFALRTLKDAWTAIGLEKFAPEPLAEVTVLKQALEEVFGGSSLLIRPLSKKDGWVVVGEKRGEDDNAYQSELTARIQLGMPAFSKYDDKTDAVIAAYNEKLGRIQSAQVASALVKVMYSLNGTALRPSGGVYWLSGEKLDRWREIVAGVEQAALGQATGYIVEHDLSADAVKAVGDAIRHEVKTETSRLQREINSGELGDRAIENRRLEIAALKAKLADYEDILGVTLADVKQGADDADQSDAVGALLLAAGGFDGQTAPEEVACGAV